MIVSLTVVAKPTDSKEEQFKVAGMSLDAASIYTGQRLEVPVAIRNRAAHWQPIVNDFGNDTHFRVAGGRVCPVASNSQFNGPDSILLQNSSLYASAMALEDETATLLFNVSTVHALPAYFVQLVNAALKNDNKGARWREQAGAY
jgi:hypothetical protein